ncbi:hypothetical protein [Jeotgalibaca porci]|uniref:hypothetical protein n=1 Tax=Jeotgalibaca porci TaxID=1868793 RepID=UPI0035A09820
MIFKSEKYKVASIKPSKARYANGVSEGDTVQFVIGKLGHTTHRGRYSSEINMVVNGKIHTVLKQGELRHVLGVLELEEVA